MYWTNLAGSIMKAGMDGSDATLVVSGLQLPKGIVIDYGSSRLFWVDELANKIQSSNLAGGDIRTVVQLSASANPQGIALYGNKLYCGNY